MPATSVTQFQDLQEEECSELTVIAEISCDYQANLDLSCLQTGVGVQC